MIVAISPWNFPLAIFLGQITAGLMAGNAVVAKPAEQTPLIAAEAIKLLHEAGIPTSALHLMQGDGKVGAALVKSSRCRRRCLHGLDRSGAQPSIARSPPKTVPSCRSSPRPAASTPMIVDATALPEQVADDVATSAFRSAGQRCSALRLLFVQDDVADRMITMIAGAANELKVGDPRDPATQIGRCHRCRSQTTARRTYRTHEGTITGAFCWRCSRVWKFRRAAYL